MDNEQKQGEEQTPKAQKQGEEQKPAAQQPKTPKSATPPRKVPNVYISKPKTDANGEPQKEKKYRKTRGTEPDLEACVAKAEAQIRESERQLGE